MEGHERTRGYFAVLCVKRDTATCDVKMLQSSPPEELATWFD